MKRVLIVAVLLALGAGAGLWWWFAHRPAPTSELTLYGNLDLRQVQLAFNNSERIQEVKVQEGDRVRQGDLVASLDTSRLEPQVAQAEAQVAQAEAQVTQAEAQVATQEQVVERLHNGSRPEEISQAKANVEAAKADAANARRQYDRLKKLTTVRIGDNTEARAVSQEEVDNARAALDVADAKLAVNQKALELAEKGPRKEEIAENEARLQANKAQLQASKAQLQANKAQLALLRQMRADAQLYAPTDAVVRSRLMEPGEMASPQKPVFSLAIIDPKWVRAYVSEPDLGKVRHDMTALVTVDSFPGRTFDGWVGFISPVAEFTPKVVQTEELRTALVYEVRVFVHDPQDELRLGMPATVRLSLDGETRR